jgi:N-acetylneuraminic acid mutarotase
VATGRIICQQCFRYQPQINSQQYVDTHTPETWASAKKYVGDGVLSQDLTSLTRVENLDER